MKLTDKLSPEATIDQTLPYAVATIELQSSDSTDIISGKIEQGLKKMSDRAQAAGMVMLNVTFCINAGLLVVAAQWMSRAAIESMQAQQRLLGGTGRIPQA
jgi:hypothetical protein